MLLAALLWAVPGVAQGGTLRGQVERGQPAGPQPLANQWVVLHRVDQQGGAPLDSTRTDGNGRFRFRLTWDTTAIYFVGTEWQDIAYLTQPVQGREPADTLETLLVWDTTRTGPPLALAQRHIVIRRPDADAGRRVLELISLENLGTATRVGTGPTGPTWSVRLPDGAFQFEVGDSDMSADAIRAFEGVVQVMAPVPPGERQLLYTYLLPGGDRTFELSADQPGKLTVLLEDTSATLTQGTLTDQGVQVFEDATFRIFDGAVAVGDHVQIRYTAGVRFSERTLALLLVAMAVIGGVVLVRLRLRRRPAGGDAQLLARQIAALDASFEARTGASPVEERRYRSHRARLKADLDRLLGTRPQAPG